MNRYRAAICIDSFVNSSGTGSTDQLRLPRIAATQCEAPSMSSLGESRAHCVPATGDDPGLRRISRFGPSLTSASLEACSGDSLGSPSMI